MKECRPYGDDGADICFACANATPQKTFQTNIAIAMVLFGMTRRDAEQAARVAPLTVAQKAHHKRVGLC